MDHTQVLVKTAKGKEEIRSKAFNLSPRLRRLLLLVDGRSTVEATLHRLAVIEDDVESQLDTLLADGFLAPRQAPNERGACSFDDWQTLAENRSVPRRDRYGTAGAHRHPPFNLDKAKGFARFVVLGYLGPVGAHRVERIESAKSADQLRAELDDLREILPKLLHKRQAKQLWDQLEPLMESANATDPHPERAPGDSAGPNAGKGARRIFAAARLKRAERTGRICSDTDFAAAILQYAEPLTDAASCSEEQSRAIRMAIICWNAATLPGNKGLETVAPALRQIANGDRQLERELFDIFEVMRARKQARFVEDNRFVVDFSLADTPTGLRLSVISQPLAQDRSHPSRPNA